MLAFDKSKNRSRSLCWRLEIDNCYQAILNLYYGEYCLLLQVLSVSLQGPLPNTCGHFWEMVWEQKSRGVVMLNRVMEKGSVSAQILFLL